ncbi:MAG: molybdenum cofactor biosynthesis protein MoaE [Methylophaga sp.]|nr:molybdenum cofactor biosynthesis protein MoaE [Methylophaga sp.]
MTIQVFADSFDAYQLLRDYQQQLSAGSYGAMASFIGTMRDFNDNASVSKMTLEHYPAMTEHYLDKLEQQARDQWPLDACLIVHRVGDILPADAIVVIGCWSAHRRAALDACAWLIEELKFNAPFWKKETRPDGERWVESNTNGVE